MSISVRDYAQLTARVSGPPARKRKKKVRLYPTEAEEQMALVSWARSQVHRYPEFARLFHIPNGEKRHIVTAIRLKEMGVLPTVPDLCLPCARRGFKAWYGEIKALDGRLDPGQEEMLLYLRDEGYYANVFFGMEETRDSLLWYVT